VLMTVAVAVLMTVAVAVPMATLVVVRVRVRVITGRVRDVRVVVLVLCHLVALSVPLFR